MPSTSIPDSVWQPIAVLIWFLILPIVFFIGIFDYKLYCTKNFEIKLGKLEIIIANAINDTDRFKMESELINMPTTAEPCSYSPSSLKLHTQKMSCEDYYTGKSDQISSLLKNEKQALEKTNKQLQELKAQLQANK